jgi:DNA-binding transcriptional LysR family regulator
LSRQIQDWEDEIGVDLLRRSPAGVNARGRREALLQEVRELLKSVDEKVEKRPLARTLRICLNKIR